MENTNTLEGYSYSPTGKILHAGLAILGIAAFLTGEGAEGSSQSTGYLLHAWLGFSLAAFIVARVIAGLRKNGPLSFTGWSPFSRLQWIMGMNDIKNLLRLRMPERGSHEGLAGLVQAFGLILFGWMSLTGIVLFIIDGKETFLLEITEELHEAGELLIPVYLGLHIGAVVAHSLAGKPVWQRIWRFKP